MLTCSQSRARARTRSAWPSPGSPSASRRRSTLAADLPAPRPTFPTLLPPVAYPPSRSLLVALARSRPRPVVVVARLAPSRPPPPSRSRSLSLAYPLLFPSSSTFLLSSDTTPFVRPPCLVNSPKSGHARRPPYPLVLPRPQPLFRNLARRLCSSGATYLRSTTPRTCISEGDIARSVRRPSRPRSPRRLSSRRRSLALSPTSRSPRRARSSTRRHAPRPRFARPRLGRRSRRRAASHPAAFGHPVRHSGAHASRRRRSIHGLECVPPPRTPSPHDERTLTPCSSPSPSPRRTVLPGAQVRRRPLPRSISESLDGYVLTLRLMCAALRRSARGAAARHGAGNRQLARRPRRGCVALSSFFSSCSKQRLS